MKQELKIYIEIPHKELLKEFDKIFKPTDINLPKTPEEICVDIKKYIKRKNKIEHINDNDIYIDISWTNIGSLTSSLIDWCKGFWKQLYEKKE